MNIENIPTIVGKTSNRHDLGTVWYFHVVAIHVVRNKDNILASWNTRIVCRELDPLVMYESGKPEISRHCDPLLMIRLYRHVHHNIVKNFDSFVAFDACR